MKKKLLVAILIVLAIIAIFVASFCIIKNNKPLESGDVTDKNLNKVGKILEEAGLGNIDTFKKMVKDSAKAAAKESGFSDADCRLTVMLLAGDQIKYNTVNENYDGDYLMFDLDAIDNDKSFSVLKSKRALFTTLFGETKIDDTGFTNTHAKTWHEHGIRLNSKNFSIISILFETIEKDKAFVGHTGILIDTKESKYTDANYVFIEKIAFGEPYKITLVNDKNELLKILSARPDYTVEEGEATPVVYENDVKIGQLSKN